MIKYGKNNLKKCHQYEKSKIDTLIPFLKENILNSRKYLFEIYSRIFSPFLKNEIMIFFERDQNKKISDKEIKAINIKNKNLNDKLKDVLNKNKLNNLLDTTNKEILELFEKYEKDASQFIKYNKNIEDIINQLNQKIEKKLKEFISKFEAEKNKILEEIKKIIKELEAQIKENLNYNEKIEIKNIKKLTHEPFDNINKGILLGSSGGGLIIWSYSIGIFTGFAGIAIGAIIGGIIIGIRNIFKYFNKTKDYLELIENSKNQYTSIFIGIKFKVETYIEEIENIIKNLINFTTNFLNKEISSIQKDKWVKTKKEFYDMSNKFENLFGKNLNNYNS